MWNLSLPWWEFILRAAVVYFFLLIAVRFSGKREIGQLSPFDLILALILSEAVQNSMVGGDESLLGGLIAASTLMLINHGIGILTFKNKKFEKLVEGTPKILIHNGVIDKEVQNKERLTLGEIEEAIREEGVLKVSDVHYAIVENNGRISVIEKKKKK